MRVFLSLILFMFAVLIAPDFAFASEANSQTLLNLTEHWVGIVAVILFVVAYAFVMAEESTHMRKSKPVVLAAGLIWMMIGYQYATHDLGAVAEAAVRHNILEFAELFLFLLAAMTYINAMEERRVFDALRSYLIRKQYSFRQLFWITGILSFMISPIADNLTTALLMCAVVMAVGVSAPKFIGLGCINIVIAANAGGAFSPFGDITTLMVWQKGVISFHEFFDLFIPSLVNYLIPAAIMHFAIPVGRPTTGGEHVEMKYGAHVVILIFIATIATAVCFHNFLHLPPVMGMMTGLGFLKMYGYYLKTSKKSNGHVPIKPGDTTNEAFDVFAKVARAEWDTLLFFYGVVLCVGGLGFIGYLSILSEGMYIHLGPTIANTLVGILSAIVDNIPVMFAVLTMNPEMSHGQWLLVTLTAGVGGSLLSIGSAAGVALMGQARGYYTFFGHLKWAPVIALGYAASIMVHFWINASEFQIFN